MVLSRKLPDNTEIVVNPYNRKDSENRKGLMLKGEWQRSIAEYVKSENIKALYLNSAKGWNGGDCSFLAELDGLEELSIVASACSGLEAIENLKNLKELAITTSTKDRIDFSKIENLEKCYLYWWRGAESILGCSSLKSLYLDKVKLKDFSGIGNLTNLTSFILANCAVEDLSWLTGLSKLGSLELLNCRKVSCFEPLRKLSELRSLVIDGSGLLNNLDFLSDLENIEYLNLSNCGSIDSLRPLGRLSNLKAFAFAGRTVIDDGDLNVLTTLPKLSMLMFQGRRAYSHKLIKKWDWKNFDVPSILLEKK